jgi:hypothetical protein
MLVLVSGITPSDQTWALEQKSNNIIGLDPEDKENNEVPKLTTRSQDALVNELISYFNEPRNIHSNASAKPCLTDDYRCCTVDPKPCIPVATITSVIDSDGIPIPFGGVTNSKEISFVFTSFVNIGAILFECSLDRSGFKPCTSPLTLSTNVSGTHLHEFQIRMSGMDPEDSPWTRFIWFRV